MLQKVLNRIVQQQKTLIYLYTQFTSVIDGGFGGREINANVMKP